MIAPNGPMKFCAGLLGDETWLNQIHDGTMSRDELEDSVIARLVTSDIQLVRGTKFDPQPEPTAQDSLSIAFELDPSARWHDGQPVRANDVRFSFQTTRDPKVAAAPAALITGIDSVSVRDSLTAVVWYKKHTPEQFYDFVYQIFIVPEHVFKSVAPEAMHTAEETRRAVAWDLASVARRPTPPESSPWWAGRSVVYRL